MGSDNSDYESPERLRGSGKEPGSGDELSPTRKALVKQRQKTECKKQVQERKADTAKRQLEISPTSDSKKEAKKKKNEKEKEVEVEDSEESDEEGEKMEEETAAEQHVPELPGTDSGSESDEEKDKNGQKANYKEILDEAKQDAKLIKSKLLKKDSEEANDAVDKLYGRRS